MNTDRTLLLIDLSGIYWTHYHATADKPLSEAFEATVSKVHSLRAGYDFVACCCDTPPYFRKEFLPGYKANRETAPPTAVEQFARIRQRLDRDGLLLWGAPTFEADDIIATAAARGVEEGLLVTIASADKDLLQLVNDDTGVRIYSPFSDKFFKAQQVIEKFGVSPDMIPDFLALVGDKSDNVPGVAGVGPVKAAKLLLQWSNLDAVLFNADKNTPGLRDALITHGQAARLARKLVELRRDAPIEWSELFAERLPKPIAAPLDAEWDDPAVDDPPPDALGDLISGPPKTNLRSVPEPKSEPKATLKGGPRATTPKIEESSGALALAQPATPMEWTLQLEPTSLSIARKLAADLHNSRLFSRKFASEEAVFAVIIRGREMGIGALTALAVTHFFDDKMSLDAHYIIARAKEHPDCEFFQYKGGDDTYAEWVTKHRRNPEPTKHRYTIAQAQLAGLTKPSRNGHPSNWTLRPNEMLRKTAAVQLVRMEFPSAALGLYCLEELGSEEAA